MGRRSDLKTHAGASAVSLVSYDYRFLLTTIPRYLPYVDEVILGVDADGLTWSGERFEIPTSFFEELRQLDGASNRIRLVARSFYSPSRSPMENDVAERNALSFEVTEGNWIVSIDADEQLLNPDEFFRFLGRQRGDDVSVEASWITVFKDLGDSLLLVAAQADGSLEHFPIATRQRGAFVAARRTDAPTILSPAIALHYSWGREKEELLQKLLNWSHSRDFDVRKYFDFWLSVNEQNYSAIRHFHPLSPDTWSRLTRVKKVDLENWERWDLGQKGASTLLRWARRAWRKGVQQWCGRRAHSGRLGTGGSDNG
jgi:hypothetical protein